MPIGADTVSTPSILLILAFSFTSVAMFSGFVNCGILLLVIVSLMGEVAGLIGSHGGEGACIMGHVYGFFHRSGIGPDPWPVRRWRGACKHGLSIGRHPV